MTDVGLHEEEVCWFMLLERVLQCNISLCRNCGTNIASWWVYVSVCLSVCAHERRVIAKGEMSPHIDSVHTSVHKTMQV